MSAEKHPLQTLIEDTVHFLASERIFLWLTKTPEGNLIFLKDEGFPYYWDKGSI